jgi:hypothetical protein
MYMTLNYLQQAQLEQEAPYHRHQAGQQQRVTSILSCVQPAAQPVRYTFQLCTRARVSNNSSQSTSLDSVNLDVLQQL